MEPSEAIWSPDGAPAWQARNPGRLPDCATLRVAPSGLRSSISPHRRHEDELPGARHLADRHLDHRRNIPRGKAATERPAQLLGRERALGSRPEALGITHEVRVGQVARDQAVAELL